MNPPVVTDPGSPPADARSVVLAAGARHPTGSPFRADPALHWTLLGLSLAVLVAACCLSVRQRTQVLLPLLDLPLPELCGFKMYSGLPCPGCGMTRCFISLAHGDLAGAWRYNPAGLLLFAIVVFQVPFRTVQLARIRLGRREMSWTRTTQWSLIALATLMIGQWVLRTLLPIVM